MLSEQMDKCVQKFDSPSQQLRFDLDQLGFSPIVQKLAASMFSGGMEQSLPNALFHLLNHLTSEPVDAAAFPGNAPLGAWTSVDFSGKHNPVSIFNFARSSLSANSSDMDTMIAQLLTRIVTQDGRRLWFHATSWDNAVRIVTQGVDHTRGSSNTDFSATGAFYLNPCMMDCYAWLLGQRASSFYGCHAMLIHNCDPSADLGPNGQDFGSPEDVQKWKKEKSDWEQLCLCSFIDKEPDFIESKISRKNKWIHGPQVKNPETARKRERPGGNSKKSAAPPVPRFNSHFKDKVAMQLAIRGETAAEKLDALFVGVVFFQNLKPSGSESLFSPLNSPPVLPSPSPEPSSAASSDSASFVHVDATSSAAASSSATAGAASHPDDMVTGQ